MPIDPMPIALIKSSLRFSLILLSTLEMTLSTGALSAEKAEPIRYTISFPEPQNALRQRGSAASDRSEV